MHQRLMMNLTCKHFPNIFQVQDRVRGKVLLNEKKILLANNSKDSNAIRMYA